MNDATAGELSHDHAGPTRGNASARADSFRLEGLAQSSNVDPSVQRHHALPVATSVARGTMFVSETFRSRQGEGILTGTESFFIRTSGCNLRCDFCDTPYASWSPKGRSQTLAELVEQVDQSGLRHVVLTGGEPMLPVEVTRLVSELRRSGFHVTIETAGTIDRDLRCDLMSISPKLASSTPSADRHPRWHQLHQQRRMPIDVMKSLMQRAEQWQLKFVVGNERDYAEVLDVVCALEAAAEQVWIMPQGVTIDEMDQAKQWLEPWCDNQGFRYCDRMQIRWYGNRRGT